MKRLLLLSVVIAVVIIAWSCASADPQAQKIARGKYLVERVGMCADCHSPRNERGDFDLARSLQGSPLPFAAKAPISDWTDAAPAIAGLPSLSEADAVKLLETGETLNGRKPRPPMPPFRFSHEDAEAAVAYLKSLTSNRS